jgi:transcriptional regulator with XRE-family HTH domain
MLQLEGGKKIMTGKYLRFPRNRIREFLAAMNDNKGCSQEECSKAIGISRQTLSNIMLGKVQPSGVTVVKLSIFFNRDAREIFPDIEI